MCARPCVKCKCVFSPQPCHDPVACLSSVYFNLSSLLPVSSRAPGLIPHRRLSLWIHLSDTPFLFPSLLRSSSYLCHDLLSSLFTSFPNILTLFTPTLLPQIHHYFLCCFAASLSVFFTVSYCFSPCLFLSLSLPSLPPPVSSLSLSVSRTPPAADVRRPHSVEWRDFKIWRPHGLTERERQHHTESNDWHLQLEPSLDLFPYSPSYSFSFPLSHCPATSHPLPSLLHPPQFGCLLLSRLVSSHQ